MNDSRRLRRAQSMRNDGAIGKPIERRRCVSARVTITSYETAVRIHSAIGPVVVYRAGKLGMQGETAARQRIERTAGAPIEGQKATCFAGSGASYLRSFNDGDIDAAPSQEIRGASSNHAAAANQDSHLLLRKVVVYITRRRPKRWLPPGTASAHHGRFSARLQPTLAQVSLTRIIADHKPHVTGAMP